MKKRVAKKIVSSRRFPSFQMIFHPDRTEIQAFTKIHRITLRRKNRTPTIGYLRRQVSRWDYRVNGFLPDEQLLNFANRECKSKYGVNWSKS